MQKQAGFYTQRDSDSNIIEDNSDKIFDLNNAQQKIKEMEESLKNMNIENDSLKGKLGNVISNLNTPQEANNKMSRDFINKNNQEEFQKNKKRKNFSSLSNNNNSEYLANHFRNNSVIPHQNEEDNNSHSHLISHSHLNENNNTNLSSPRKRNYRKDSIGEFSNYNNRNFQQKNMLRDSSGNNPSKWNRHLTLGKSAQTNLVSSSEDLYRDNNEGDFNNRGSNSHINENLRTNPFVDNNNTFINNDYENMYEKVSNLGNVENEDMYLNNNEEGYFGYNNPDIKNVAEFPLQVKKRGIKKKGAN